MRIKLSYILPVVLGVTTTLYFLDILHIGSLHIKSHELRITELSYSWFPDGDDIFTAGESVSNNNYEEGLLAINPDYQALLDEDLAEISAHRDNIDSINNDDLSISAGPYRVKLCLDYKRITHVDSSLFKRFCKLDILGQLEFYDRENGDLLMSNPDRKFWIRDSVIFKGIASRELIGNKLEEIWLAQVSDHVSSAVEQFDRPRKYANTVSGLIAYMGIVRMFDGEENIDYNEIQASAYDILFEIRRAYQNGSPTYGYHKDPNYTGVALGISQQAAEKLD